MTQLEQWVCRQDSQGNPGCGFVLIMGITGEVPQKCPKCGGRAWDIIGDPQFCRVTKGKHDWSRGIDGRGFPELDVDQVCRACGAVPVLQGVAK